MRRWRGCSSCCASRASRPTRPTRRAARRRPNGAPTSSPTSASTPASCRRRGIRWSSPTTRQARATGVAARAVLRPLRRAAGRPASICGPRRRSSRHRTDPANGQVIVARGAEDNKGQLMTFFEAVRAWKAVAGKLPISVSVMLEGEEECGSPSLPAFLAKNGEELKADRRARVRHRPVGQGHAGDHHDAARARRRSRSTVDRAVARPALGHLRRPGDQSDPRARRASSPPCTTTTAASPCPASTTASPSRRRRRSEQWSTLGFRGEAFLGAVGLKQPAGESDRSVLEQLWSRPTLEFNGITGGYQGVGTKTVIPSKASVKITCRLVAGQDPNKLLASIEEFVRARLPADCTAEFSGKQASTGISFDTTTAFMQAAAAALARGVGQARRADGLRARRSPSSPRSRTCSAATA